MSIMNFVRVVVTAAAVGAAVHLTARALAARSIKKEKAAVEKAGEEKLAEVTAALDEIELEVIAGKINPEEYVAYVKKSVEIIAPIAASSHGKRLLKKLRSDLADHYEAQLIDVLTYVNGSSHVRQAA